MSVASNEASSYRPQRTERKIELSASVMCADFRRLGEQFRTLDAAGIDSYHWDIIDGHFAPNFTLSAGIMEMMRGETDRPFEVHMMVQEPERFIDDFAKAGAQLIVIHQEVTIHLRRLVQQIRKAGIKAGVALNPVTPLDPLVHVLEDISQVIIMTVDAGFAGQPFAKSVLPKIDALRQIIDERHLDVAISADGGINPRTIGQVVGNGASVLVLGSTGLFGDADFAESLRATRELATQTAAMRGHQMV